MDYSIMFFASLATGDARDHYRLLLDAAKTADRRGLSGIWTPERHFDEFGGVFPNPAVTSAALASATTNIRLHAGSVISPLHDPILLAEDWSVVDNFSNGRVSVSFGSGWNPDDFVFAPASYAKRKALMEEQIATFLQLWQGGSVPRENGVGGTVDVSLSPRPVQPRPPIWITTGGTPETFRWAGASGFNVLTHIITQESDELAERIALYRTAREGAGHDPDSGRITVMMHTFVGEDDEHARGVATLPLRGYLESAMRLEIKAAGAGGQSDEYDPEIIDELVSLRIDRYFAGQGLLGGREHCECIARQFESIGVDEIACLIDFGIDHDHTLASLNRLCDFAKA
jgi:natural product biosynthesis luciferase-like monooxygenase protein